MRCYPSTATKYAPASILLGRKIKTPSGWPKIQECNEGNQYIIQKKVTILSGNRRPKKSKYTSTMYW